VDTQGVNCGGNASAELDVKALHLLGQLKDGHIVGGGAAVHLLAGHGVGQGEGENDGEDAHAAVDG